MSRSPRRAQRTDQRRADRQQPHPATRGVVIARRPAGPSPAASTGRLPPVEPDTSATVSSATPISGAAAADTSTSPAPARPPQKCQSGGRPERAAANGRAAARRW